MGGIHIPRASPDFLVRRFGGQCVQPCRILLLEAREAGDCVVPALDPTAPVDRTADANDRLAIRVRGTVARLTFGAGHGCVADRWTRHGSTPKRHVTNVIRKPHQPRRAGAGTSRRSSSWPT